MPGDLNCVAGATAKQGVFIWDINKDKIVKRFTEVSVRGDIIAWFDPQTKNFEFHIILKQTTPLKS